MFHFGPSIAYRKSLSNSVAGFQELELFQCMFIQKKMKPEDQKFIANYKHNVYLHGNYTWNPANPKFKYDVALTLQQLLPAMDNTNGHLILHFNSGSIKQVYDTLTMAQTNLYHLCMENMVGAGKQCGINEEQIRQFIELFDTNLPSFCFDTQHSFAAGWSDYTTLECLEFFRDEHLNLQLIHLNDSGVQFGSAKDRHGNVALGEGYIWADNSNRLYDLICFASEYQIDCIDEGRNYFTSREFVKQLIDQYS